MRIFQSQQELEEAQKWLNSDEERQIKPLPDLPPQPANDPSAGPAMAARPNGWDRPPMAPSAVTAVEPPRPPVGGGMPQMPLAPRIEQPALPTAPQRERRSVPDIVGIIAKALGAMGGSDAVESVIKREDEQKKLGIEQQRLDVDRTIARQDKERDFALRNSKEQREAAEARDLNDPNSQLSKDYQQMLASVVGEEGVRGKSAAVLLKVVPEIRAAREATARREEARSVREASSNDKQAAADEKRSAAAQATAVPGFRPNGKVRIDEIEARKLRDGLAEYRTFMATLNDYVKNVKDHGTTEWVGAEAAEMQAQAKRLQLAVKNLAQLGVLSASDIPFIEQQIPNPGFFKSQSGMLGALASSKKMAGQSLRNQMLARGLELEDQSLIEGEAAAVPPSTMIKVTNGRETMEIEPADEADAARDGFRRIS